MEILCPRSVISTARSHDRSFRLGRSHGLCSSTSRLRRSLSSRGRPQFRLVRSKLSDFQDFQRYAKPSRLLPATEVKVSNGMPPDEKPKLFENDSSQALYKIKIRTSRMYGSSLSNENSGLLICIIDENGDSVLQRIPAVGASSSSSGEVSESNTIHFQQGSDDEFSFKGPKLGRIQALWISLESGQWRLGGLDLLVVYPPSGEDHRGDGVLFTGFRYDFLADDILLGEGSDASIVELRPCLVRELCGPDPLILVNQNSEGSSASSLTSQTSNAKSTREYEDLKISLLLYDAVLIVIGSWVLSISLGEHSAFAFSTGGVAGFLYLLLLQRSVDDLPSPASISRKCRSSIWSALGAGVDPSGGTCLCFPSSEI